MAEAFNEAKLHGVGIGYKYNGICRGRGFCG
jgi:hypothetical protein